jgi:type I restriction enzyme S subunit
VIQTPPPGYKQTEIGVIPENWKVDRIGGLFSFLSTSSCPRSDLSESEEVYYIHYGDIHTKWDYRLDFETENVPRIAADKVKNATLLADGDLILVDASEDEVGAGKGIEVTNLKGRSAVSGLHTIALRQRGNDFVDGFKAYIQSMRSVQLQIRHLITGLKVYGISKTNLATVMVPVPSLPEQRAIAEVLSDVDALIAALDRLIAKKRAIKQGAMQQLLTGRSRLHNFNDDWTTTTLGRAFQFLRTASNSRGDLSQDGEVKYIHYGDIHTKWLAFLDCDRDDIPRIKESRLPNVTYLEDGDLVIADASEDYEGIGASVEVKNATGRRVVAGLHTLLLRGDKRLLADGFKGYLQYIPTFKKALIEIATGISVYGLSKNKIQQISLHLPPLEEQRAIATVLSDMDAEISALEARRDKTRALKQGMMQELLTGRTRLL